MPPTTFFMSRPLGRYSANGTSSSRTFFFAAKICRASALNDGAMTISRKMSFISSAVSPSTSRLVPTMPPKIDTGSQARHLRNASASEHCGGRHAARVGVLDGHGDGLAELLHQLEGGVGVDDVVERELLPLELRRLGDGRLRPDVAGLAIEGGLLMRVFAVAEILRLDELEMERLTEALALAARAVE